MEIGAYKGKSAAWLIEATETRADHPPVVSIDPHAQYDTWDEFSATVAEFKLEKRGLEICRAQSHEVGVKWDRPISLLWIDGSHEYEDVVNDIEDFVPHVVPGGWVVFDDAASDDFGIDPALESSMFNREEFKFLGYLKHFAIFQRR